jgi:hypothetical protein
MGEGALPSTFGSTKDQSNFCSAFRVLNRIGDPTENLAEQCFVSAANDMVDVFSEERPVAWLGFDSKAPPQVVS